MQGKNSGQESLQLLSVTSQMNKLTILMLQKRWFSKAKVINSTDSLVAHAVAGAFSNFMWNQQALCPVQRQVSATKAEETTMNSACWIGGNRYNTTLQPFSRWNLQQTVAELHASQIFVNFVQGNEVLKDLRSFNRLPFRKFTDFPSPKQSCSEKPFLSRSACPTNFT